MIHNIQIMDVFDNFLDKDENGRIINIYKSRYVQFSGDNIFYPTVIFEEIENRKLYNPIDETIMSLRGIDMNVNLSRNLIKHHEETPVFFFIYNTDNYFHFVYDTLPYLLSYIHLKNSINNLKLLVNFPNYQSKKIYPFVLEFLQILDINETDMIFADKNTVYSNIFISDSYTHGKDSNLPPRSEIFELYKKIVNKIKKKGEIFPNLAKKIYISRRSWLNSNISNIGTNYTLKRQLDIENELVEILVNKGYTEIFTEELSTIEKILLFAQVDEVVSLIGGGSCNTLFSKPETKHICIVSPTFLEINKRFMYCLSNNKTEYFMDTWHVETERFKKFMRVKYKDIVGEVIDYDAENVLINYTENFVAGWNSQLKLKQIWVPKIDCSCLDDGLNSRWTMNILKLKQIL